MDTPRQIEAEAQETKLSVNQAAPSLATSELAPGSFQAGRYRVKSLIGQGGMGKVYQVEQVFLKKDFALKMLTSSSMSQVAWRRFQKEAKALSLLDHPAIVKVHDFGVLDEVQPFFVMDLVEGETLASLLKKGALEIDTTLEIFRQVCEGVAYAHAQGVIHRDIKPGNILVMNAIDGPIVKIVDFGIAKVLTFEDPDSIALTRTGEVFGTPYYMSPEQCAGSAIDSRSDIYSIGCVLFEALTGTPPFLGDTALATVIRHQSEKPPTLKQASLGKTFPNGCEQVVAKLLEKDPNARYRNLYQVAHDLQCIRLEQSVKLGAKSTKSSDAKDKLKPYGWMKFAVGACACLIAFVLGHFTAPRTQLHHTVLPPVAPERSEFDAVDKLLDPQVGVTTRGFFSAQPERANWRYFHFPNETLGTLVPFTGGPNSAKLYKYRNQRFIAETKCPSQGEVFVDQFQPLRLVASAFLISNMSCVHQFHPDEIIAVRIPPNKSNFVVPINDETIKTFTYFTGLQELMIFSGAKLTDASVDWFDCFNQLKILSCKDTSISSARLAKLKRLKQLTSLQISVRDKKINAVLSSLSGSTALNELVAASGLNRESMKYIGNLPNLKTLAISLNDGINDDDLAQLLRLKKLTKLEIDSCAHITPAAIKYLAKMPLQELVIRKGQFLPSVKSAWQAALTHCKLVEWHDLPVDD